MVCAIDSFLWIGGKSTQSESTTLSGILDFLIWVEMLFGVLLVLSRNFGSPFLQHLRIAYLSLLSL